MQSMRSIAYEMALAQAPVAEDDLIIFILNGVGMELRQISTVMKARESTISPEDLHDKLTDFEAVIKQEGLVIAPVVTANMVRRGRGYDHQQQRNNSFKGNASNSFSSRNSFNLTRKNLNQFNANSCDSRPTC